MKKIIFILSILLIFVFGLIYFLSPQFFLKMELNYYNQTLKKLSDSLKEYPEITMGNLTGSLNYIGAHKEPYKTKINYYFAKEKETFTLWNEQEFTSIKWNNELTSILKWIKETKFSDNFLEIIDKKNQTYDLNTKTINDNLNTNFQSTKLKIDIKKFFPQIKTIHLYFDEYHITLEKQNIYIQNTEQQIRLLPNGLTIIKDNLKLQIEIKENLLIYHLIYHDNVFLLERTKETLILKSSTPKESFHSFEITLEQEEKIPSKPQKETKEGFPILKYLENLNLKE